MNPFQVVKDFEKALSEYTGAPYVVTTTSCTMALLLAVAYYYQLARFLSIEADRLAFFLNQRFDVEIPKRTYQGVPMSIIHAGGRPTFRDENWSGAYRLKPLPVWDSARWFTSGMWNSEGYDHGPYRTFEKGSMVCLSFHWAKTLGIEQGGAILHDNAEADAWLRRARFDGRAEGVDPKADAGVILGWHAYMSPETAAAGLKRLSHLPRHNAPLPNDEYPDLSQMEIFK